MTEQAIERLRYLIEIDREEEAINEPINEKPKAIYTSDRIKLGDVVRIINTEIYGTVVKIRYEHDIIDEAIATIEYVAKIDGKPRLVREELLEFDLIRLEVVA